MRATAVRSALGYRHIRFSVHSSLAPKQICESRVCNLQVTNKTRPVEEWSARTYHRVMAKQFRSDKNSDTKRAQAIRFHGALPALPLPLLLSALPFFRWSGLANLSAVVVRLFQNNDRTSTWLAFGLVWVACAIAALASAGVVFCVGETRKRILSR